ncbi:hypothetical protein [Methylocystis heyeri]|uniref:Uncharacterized protein n=1 Tax=Methylocystis heyeri TaxID=391905 RepID=A0A6B8KD31_9HYPH|nr:hypothetical protein [Methylocystis heyeri]QGM44333.1 hypothetical protein H2LOC_000685 [Methylocystis heyeri]
MPPEDDELSPAQVDARLVLRVAGGVLVLLASGVGVSIGLYDWMAPSGKFKEPTSFPSPSVLQTNNRESIADRNPYAAPDADGGAIPIEQAMEMIARRGADAYSPIEQKSLAQQKSQPPSEENVRKPAAKTQGRPRRHGGGGGRGRSHRG